MHMHQEKRSANKWFLGVASSVLLAAILWLVTTAWSTKADRLELIGHIQADAVLYVSDTAWKREQRDLVVEILCHQNPKSRRCGKS